MWAPSPSTRISRTLGRGGVFSAPKSGRAAVLRSSSRRDRSTDTILQRRTGLETRCRRGRLPHYDRTGAGAAVGERGDRVVIQSVAPGAVDLFDADLAPAVLDLAPGAAGRDGAIQARKRLRLDPEGPHERGGDERSDGQLAPPGARHQPDDGGQQDGGSGAPAYDSGPGMRGASVQ